MQDEAAQASLARTLRVSAQASNETIDAVERHITSLGKLVGVTDDEARPAFATLTLATKDVQQAQQLLAIALDTSAATGKPLADVAEALSKGFAGNTRGLKQLSPELFQLIKKGASAAEAFAVLEANFGGAAQTAAGTTAGQLKILKVQLDETKEAIGLALLPVLEKLLPLFQSMATFISNNVPLIVALGTAFATLSGIIIALRAAIAISTVANFALAASLTAVQIATVIGIASVAVGTAAFIAYKKSMKSVTDEANTASGALDGLTGATKNNADMTKRAIENNDGLTLRLYLTSLAEAARKKAAEAATAAATKAAAALSQYTSALQGFGSAQKAVKDAAKSLTEAKLDQRGAFYDLITATENFNKVSKGYGANSKQAKDATRNLAQAQRDAVRANISLREATQSVTEAQKRLDDLRSGKAAKTAQEELDIASERVTAARQALADTKSQFRSYDDQASANDRLNEALDEQRQAQLKVNEAIEASNPQAIADAEDNLTTAKLNLEEATIGQADATQDVLDKQLLLTQALTGATTETDIYKEAALQMAQAQNNLRTANDGVTLSLIEQAEAQRELNNAKADLKGATTGTTTTQRTSASKRTGIKIPKLAAGGIVNQPTLAMIGESGAEAVIPLNKMQTGTTYNITVNAGITATPAQIGQQIIDAIKTAERKSGQVFAAA